MEMGRREVIERQRVDRIGTGGNGKGMGEGWKWGWRLERGGRGVKIRRGELDKGRDDG